MQRYINRQASGLVLKNLKLFPAVAILGPRQCGKSTLALKLGKNIKNFLYLDLELPSDARKLTDPELFFEANQDKTICLDEIHLMPGLFSVLRGIIDKSRRNGRFLILGSASPELIKQSSQTLAGRIAFIELTPFIINEVADRREYNFKTFWLKGGYPDSFLSPAPEDSLEWRNNFIKTFIERDIPNYNFHIPAPRLSRFLRICAHFHGQIINLQKIGQSLGVSYHTVKNYIDIFEHTYIFRLLEPLTANLKKRLVKSPKFYIRDSGLLHALLEITAYNDLLGHPAAGASWEGFVLENILSQPGGWRPYFYKTGSGNEIDLILEKGRKKIAVECKLSAAPALTKGLLMALEQLKINDGWIISPVQKSFSLNKNIRVATVSEFIKYLGKQ